MATTAKVENDELRRFKDVNLDEASARRHKEMESGQSIPWKIFILISITSSSSWRACLLWLVECDRRTWAYSLKPPLCSGNCFLLWEHWEIHHRVEQWEHLVLVVSWTDNACCFMDWVEQCNKNRLMKILWTTPVAPHPYERPATVISLHYVQDCLPLSSTSVVCEWSLSCRNFSSKLLCFPNSLQRLDTPLVPKPSSPTENNLLQM